MEYKKYRYVSEENLKKIYNISNTSSIIYIQLIFDVGFYVDAYPSFFDNFWEFWSILRDLS